MPAPQRYSDMTEREAILRRALDRIAEGANPSLKPGHPDYMSKAQVQARCKRAILEYNATFETE
jgi:hypothetical protein